MKKFLVMCLMCIFLTACGTGMTNTTYSRSQIGKTGSTSTGVIVSITVVETEGSGAGVGTLVGGAAGAIAGHSFGGGHGSALLAAGGGLAGAMIGNVAGKAITKDTACEFLIQEDKTGDVIMVVQSNELGLQPGDAVIMVELDGVKRIRSKMPVRR